MPKGFSSTEDEQQVLDSDALNHVSHGGAQRGSRCSTSTSRRLEFSRCRSKASKHPILVINAADDCVSSDDDADAAAARIPTANFVRLGSGGHLVLGADAEIRRAAVVDTCYWALTR